LLFASVGGPLAAGDVEHVPQRAQAGHEHAGRERAAPFGAGLVPVADHAGFAEQVLRQLVRQDCAEPVAFEEFALVGCWILLQLAGGPVGAEFSCQVADAVVRVLRR